MDRNFKISKSLEYLLSKKLFTKPSEKKVERKELCLWNNLKNFGIRKKRTAATNFNIARRNL